MPESVAESPAVGGETVEPYNGGNAYSEYNNLAGGRRRGRRSTRRNMRRRSRRNMRRMYRGGEDVVTNTGGEDGPPNIGGEMDIIGGRRRRRRGKTHKGKMHKGKMHKGKTRRGKVSKWINHVKHFSRVNKMDFRDALKHPNCKATYHKMK